MIRDELGNLIQEGITASVSDNSLPELIVPEIAVEHTTKPEYGDYASSVALKMSRAARQSPARLAEVITAHIPPHPFVEKVEVAAPGFINFRLSPSWRAAQIKEALKEGENYGNLKVGQGQSVQIEFVSANPTGPVTIAAARGAAIGDTLANLLQAAGYNVEREYYVNDAGSRMDVFYRNVWYFYQRELGRNPAQPPTPYPTAEYAAKEIVQREGSKFLDLPETEALETVGPMGIEIMIDDMRRDLEKMGVNFNVWFREQSLFESGEVTETLDVLRQNGHVAEKEGAIWFVSTALGQEKDNVLIRSDAKRTPTYFVSDIAYHNNKFNKRRFNKVIDVWGADHQGHIPRLKAALSAIDLNPEDLTIIVMQMVTVNGQKMKKAFGNVVLLRDVLEVAGADAVRFNLVSRSADTALDFDLDLAVTQSNENPVYYVQYAHARISSILRLAAEKNLDFAEADLSLLGNEDEQALINQMALLPELIEEVSRSLEPQRLLYYAMDLAAKFHAFYTDNRVVDEANLPLSQARLQLVQAVKITLAKTLHLMGMTAPETM